MAQWHLLLLCYTGRTGLLHRSMLQPLHDDQSQLRFSVHAKRDPIQTLALVAHRAGLPLFVLRHVMQISRYKTFYKGDFRLKKHLGVARVKQEP